MQTVTPPVTTPNPAATTQVNLLTTQAVPTLTQLPVAIVSLAQGDSAIVNGVTVSRQGNTLVLQDADGSTQQVSGFFDGHLDEVERLARLRAALEGNDAYTHGDTGLTSADVVPADYQEVAALGEPTQLAQADGGAAPAASNGPVFASGTGIAPAAGLGLASAAVIAPASLALAAAAVGSGVGAPTPLSAEAVAAANSEAALEQVAQNAGDLTAEQLSAIQGVTGVDADNLEAYKAYVAENGATFGDGATVEEVQAMVGEVNALELIKNNPAALTIEQLNAIESVEGVDESNLAAYKDYISTHNGTFTDGATAVEVQAAIAAVNKVAVTIEGVLTQTQGGLIDGGATTDTTPTIRVSFANDTAYGFGAGNSIQLYNGLDAMGAAHTVTAAEFAQGYVDMTTLELAAASYNIRAASIDSNNARGPLTVDSAFDITVNTAAQAVATVAMSDIVNGTGGFVIKGVAEQNILGSSVKLAGDVNGDGYNDIIVGEPQASFDGYNRPGRSYVLFGGADVENVDLADVIAGTATKSDGSSAGFVINGTTHWDFSGYAVSSAGDFNGDGLDDLLIGAPYADATDANDEDGRVFLVYGQTDGTAVNLADVQKGVGGFSLKGSVYELARVSEAGDLNGDGLADIVIGDNRYNSGSGQAYVVFGNANGYQASTAGTEDTAEAAAQTGFLITPESSGGFLGWSISTAGDVNGDGLSDLIVSAKDVSTAAFSRAGAAYVVYGKIDHDTVDLADIDDGQAGFAIRGAAVNEQVGSFVAAAGDVNGDGYADVAVANLNGPNGRTYVVFGGASNSSVVVNSLGVNGFVVDGGDVVTSAVSSAGDINGDGLTDLLIAAPSAGKAYVVFGKTDTASVALSDVEQGVGGFVLSSDADSYFGGKPTLKPFSLSGSVSAAGDINGDGLADLLVGSAYADRDSSISTGTNEGAAYVIFGSTTGAFADTAVDQMGTSGNDTLAASGLGQTLVGDAGNDTLIAKGESVLYGGMGDDTMVVDAGMVAGLQHTGVSTVQARVDGGGGIDTIKLSGDVALDLTAAPNQAGGSSPAGGSRIDSVEVVDLVAGEGANKLTIAAHDVFDMSSFNVFEATGRAQLLVNGDSADTVELDGVWSNEGASTVSYGGSSYDVWNSSSTLATIYVEQGINVM